MNKEKRSLIFSVFALVVTLSMIMMVSADNNVSVLTGLDRYDYYTGSNNAFNFDSSNNGIIIQSFKAGDGLDTTGRNYSAKGVQLYLGGGGSAGTFTFKLVNATNETNCLTNETIAYGESDTFTVPASVVIYNWTFWDYNQTVFSQNYYCLLVTGSAVNLQWRVDTAGSLPNGFAKTLNSQGWNSNYDMWFEIWGENYTASPPVTSVSLNITYPQNKSYSNTTWNPALNHTITGDISACWWSNNSGITNQSLTCGTNITVSYTNYSQGSNTWKLYSNDTSNVLSNTSVTFFLDTVYPLVNIVYPQNATYNININSLNYTVSDLNLQTCKYTLDLGITNTTIICGNNVTGLISREGNNTWIVYVNDSADNVNSSTITFFKDTNPPLVILNTPGNNSFVSNQTNNFTRNVSDLYNITVGGSGILTDILAYYSLDDNKDATGIYNLTNRTGTYHAGKVGNGIYGDWIYAQGNQFSNWKMNYTNTFSYCFWMNSSQGTVTLAEHFGLFGTVDSYYENLANSNRIDRCGMGALITGDGPQQLQQFSAGGDMGGNQINDNIATAQWEYRCLVHNSSGLNFYKDGAYVSRFQQGAYTGNQTTFIIGAMMFNGSYVLFQNITLDEIGVWERELNGSDITILYNGGAGLNYSQLLAASSPSTVLANSSGLKNTTIFIYNQTESLVNSTTTTLGAGVYQAVIGTTVTLIDGIYKWFVDVFDNGGNVYNTGNYTLTIDSTGPILNITYPLNTTYTSNVIALNYTVSDIAPQTCKYSLNLGVTNTTITCGDNITAISSSAGSNTWKVYANDSAGNTTSSSVTFLVVIGVLNATLINPNNSVYVNASNINFTWNVTDTFLNGNITNTTIYVYSGTPLNPIWNGLYAYYPLDNNSDVTGNGLDLNNRTGTYVVGKIGKALSNDWIYGQGSQFSKINANYTNDISMCMWTYSNSSLLSSSQAVAGTTTIIGNLIDRGGIGFGHFNVGTTWQGSWGSGPISSDITDYIINRDGWHYNCVIKNQTGLYHYINGTLVASNLALVNTTWNGSIIEFVIGGVTSSGGVWTGLIDELGIWNRGLSHTEVQTLYNNGNGISFQSQGSVLINQTIKNSTDISDIFSTVVSVPITLVDGVYHWFVDAYDSLGHIFATQNNTFTVDTISPMINMTFPEGFFKNYTFAPTALNYTLNETNPQTCWYVLNILPLVTIPCGNNVTGILASQGLNQWTIYVNDSTGAQASSSNQFFVDSIAPYYVNLNPMDAFNFSISDVNFTANVYDDGVGLANVTLRVYNQSSGALVNDTINYYSGNKNINYSTVISFNDGNYLWSLESRDLFNNFNITNNRSFEVHLTGPEIMISYPANISYKDPYVTNLTKITQLNWTISELHPGDCWYNINDGNNVSVGCFDNTTTLILNYSNVPYNITFFANDTFGNKNSDRVTPTFGYIVLESGQQRAYDNFTWETQYRNYSINLSYDNIDYNITSILLNYNGYVNGSATLYNANGSNIYATGSIDVPAIAGFGNVTSNFYWIVNLTNATSTISASTFSSNQTVGNILFGECNDNSTTMNNTVRYLNVTFKDELSLTAINESLSTFNTNYYLGRGSTYEIMSYSNVSQLDLFPFCFNPGQDTPLHLGSLAIQYTGNPFYFARNVLYPTLDITNSSTELVLYNIQSGQGSYTSFYLTDLNNNVLPNVNIIMDRIISGFPFDMTEMTDSTGIATFWVNPNQFYTVTFSRADCTTKILSIRPTQSSYGVQLQCGNVTNATVSTQVDLPGPVGPPAYIYDGVTFRKAPISGVIQAGTYLFEFRVDSVIHNIVKARMDLVDGDFIVSSITKYAGNVSCTQRYCYMNFSYAITQGKDLRGKYYVDFGAGYISLENDARWREIGVNQSKTPNLKTGINDLTHVFDEYTDETGLTVQAQNKAEFSRIVLMFLLMAILFAFFNKYSGYDAANPGAFLLVMAVIVFVGSVGGFFYLNNMVPEPHLGGNINETLLFINGTGTPTSVSNLAAISLNTTLIVNQSGSLVPSSNYFVDKGYVFAISGSQYMGQTVRVSSTYIYRTIQGSMAHFLNNFIIFIYMAMFVIGYFFSVSRRQT